MDIESYEYPFFLNLDYFLLKNIKQFVVEFHGIFDDSPTYDIVTLSFI